MRPLTDIVPLRKTTVWGGFREALPIANRYGETFGVLIQYDQERKIFVWAGHASEGIDDVEVNGLSVGGWTWRNGQDSTGKAVTFIEFLSPQAESDTIIARGRGKLHPVTGARMVNPATVLWDLLTNICGNQIPESAFDRFRTETNMLGITIAGSIESEISIQSQAREIVNSIGAFFSPDCLGYCKIYPGGTPGVTRETIDSRFELTADSARTPIYNSVTVNYAYENGNPRKSIKLEASESIARYGLSEYTIEAKWVISPRVAHDVGKRFISAYSRPHWKATASGIKAALRVGDTVTPSHPVLPSTSNSIVLQRAQSFVTGTTEIEFEAFVGQVPVSRITQQSEAFTTNSFVGIGIENQGSERLLILKEQDGSPIVNAAVKLNGETTRYTDASGRVTFPAALMPPGEHTLEITTEDGRTLTNTVLVA